MAYAITVPTASGNLLDAASGGPVRLLGWSVRTGANAVTIDIREGSSSGKVIATIGLAALGADTEWFGPEGVISSSDVLYATVTGTTPAPVGSVWIA